MVVYSVSWNRDSELSKGSSKSKPKADSYIFGFTVLCNSSKEATACLEYLFPHHFGYNCGFTIEDGVVSLSRIKLDSRKFFFQYIFMDSMKHPLDVHDLYSGKVDLPKFNYWKHPVYR